jgi:hypothetical protein
VPARGLAPAGEPRHPAAASGDPASQPGRDPRGTG